MTKQELVERIKSDIYNNMQQKITGQVLQDVLIDMLTATCMENEITPGFEQFCFLVPAGSNQVIYKHPLANIEYHIKDVNENWQSGQIKLRNNNYYHLNVIGTIEVSIGEGYNFGFNTEQEMVLSNNTLNDIQIQFNVFTFKECDEE